MDILCIYTVSLGQCHFKRESVAIFDKVKNKFFSIENVHEWKKIEY